MRRDLEKYLRSISMEIKATKNRIRYLIGGVHWLTDGEHKETIFRRILSNHISEAVRVGNGFICYPDQALVYPDRRNVSTQIDVLITHKDKPTLYKEEGLVIVTPDAVVAIVEVKTKRSLAELREDLVKLANNAQKTREAVGLVDCWVGLFVFEPLASESMSSYCDVIQLVRDVVDNNPMRVINCIAIGENLFVRYWEDGNDVYSPVDGAVWHSYNMQGLSQGYFLGNLVWAVSPSDPAYQNIWFPIENGKEQRRQGYIGMLGQAQQFSQKNSAK